MAQTRFSRQVEAQWATHNAVMAVLGHVCKTHAATPEALKAALDAFTTAEVGRSLELRIRQPHDVFEGLV